LLITAGGSNGSDLTEVATAAAAVRSYPSTRLLYSDWLSDVELGIVF